MTRAELEKLSALKAEIEAIEREIDQVEPEAVVADVYKDYTRDPQGITKIMRGSNGGDEAMRRLTWRRRRFVALLRQKVEEAEEFIEGVEDPELRTILRLTYISGATQEEIGAALGYERSVISRRLTAFWKGEEDGGQSGEV